MLFAMLLLMAAGASHAEESISVPSINVEPGTQAEIVINCEFTNENITLYQFDLYLPEGFTPAYDADEEDWVYTLSSRHKKSHRFAMTNNGSFYRVVVSSNTNKLIAPGSGELLKITVDVAETVTGTHRATIKQFSMFETDETEHPMADYSFNLVAPSAVIHVEDISVNPPSVTLTSENTTAQLSATITPSNATDKSVRWESNNTSVATVDGNGLVTAISTGTAIVTAHTNDGNFAASCTVTVDFPAPKEYISVAVVNVVPGSQAEIAIDCEFANGNITLYQFDLYLPEGITPAYDADDEDWVYTLSSRHKKDHQFAMTDNGSFYRVVVSSNTNKLIAPGSGELLRITVDVAGSVSGTQQASIRNFSMFETDETEHPMDDVYFNLIAPIDDNTPDVTGKTFTLRCERGYVGYDGSTLCSTTQEAASEFAIVNYGTTNYLYDVTNKAFVVHSTAAMAEDMGNRSLESSTYFAAAVTGLTWGKTGFEAYPWYLEDCFTNWMNMDGDKKVCMNTWKDFEGGNGGNTYQVEIVSTSFDATEAIQMLDNYFQTAVEVTDEQYQAALNSVGTDTQYAIYTLKGSTRYYLTSEGYLTAHPTRDCVLTFARTEGDGLFRSPGWKVDACFSNPKLSENGGESGALLPQGHILTDTGNHRDAWEGQIWYLGDNGCYAVRATNAVSDTWGANTYWTVLDNNGDGVPEADYSWAPAFVWQLESDVVSVGIRDIDNGQAHEAGAWYTLDGRKLSGKPATKGIFIRNSKKVVVR